MEFGKKNLSSGNSDFDKETYPVFEHINDMYEVTVCDKTSPKASCLNRTCDDCGVSKLSFCTDELDNSKTARRVTLDTSDKKYRRGNHKWTIKINWKHRRRKINTYVFCWLQIKVVTRAGSGSKTPGPKSIIRD